MRAVLPSPLGMLTLTEENGALTRLEFTPDAPARMPETPLLKEAALQLQQYFTGARKVFSLPLAPRGTAFQRSVWAQLLRIPYAETITYAHLARQIGRPGACRAVGNANGRNPLPILIPCHRVVAVRGTGGYAGGPDRKAFLLSLEKQK